jgi:hypothetical protein
MKLTQEQLNAAIEAGIVNDHGEPLSLTKISMDERLAKFAELLELELSKAQLLGKSNAEPVAYLVEPNEKSHKDFKPDLVWHKPHERTDWVITPLVRASLPAEQDAELKWAEGLILQLPFKHDGRNSWLLNHGTSDQAEWLRKNREKLMQLTGEEHTKFLTESLEAIAKRKN